MDNYSERFPPKYLQITSWTQLNENKYAVELFFKTNAEGVNLKIKAIYYFVKENGNWKYDGWKSLSEEEL